jgi:hypothetical protein
MSNKKMENTERIRKQYLALLSKAENDSNRHQEIEIVSYHCSHYKSIEELRS